MKSISFILPVYNEEESLQSFYEALRPVAESLSQHYQVEMLFVNDGSKDNSLSILLGLREKDPRVGVINFSRNFGQQPAVFAGLRNATGNIAIVMDTDLQDPPEVALALVSKWEEGFEVVYAKRRSRKDPWWKVLAIYIYYRLLNRLTATRIPKDAGDFRLLGPQALAALRSLPERNPYITGLSSFVGYKQAAVLYDRAQREQGVTKYSLGKLFKRAADGMLGFSRAPLYLAGYVSAVCFLTGLVWGGILLYRSLFLSRAVPLVGVIVVIDLLFCGVVSMLLLVLGFYLSRVYDEVLNRPLFIIDSLYPARQKISSESTGSGSASFKEDAGNARV